jgi:hypothetical protein
LRVLVRLRLVWRIRRGLGNFEAEQDFVLKSIHYDAGVISNSSLKHLSKPIKDNIRGLCA